jgi:hypothetical protein
MSDPLDFTDGYIQCDRCGQTFPVGDAHSAMLSTYRVVQGMQEYNRVHQTVCPSCFSEVKRRNLFQKLRDWGATIFIGVLVVGMIVFLFYVILGALRVR